MVKSEQSYKTLVPKVDRDGNELAGIRGIEIRFLLHAYRMGTQGKDMARETFHR